MCATGIPDRVQAGIPHASYTEKCLLPVYSRCTISALYAADTGHLFTLAVQMWSLACLLCTPGTGTLACWLEEAFRHACCAEAGTS